ncbi:hypothetical protein DCC79_09695, partial [bacterium]
MASPPHTPVGLVAGPAGPLRRPALGSAVLVVLGLAVVAAGAAVSGYVYLAAALPPAEELAARSAPFRSTRIYDRNGNLLNEAFNPDAGRRTVVPLGQVSPFLVQATIATEDANFYDHGGVDPVAIARAAWYALREREVVSGASTIPQQLVKLVLLTSERSVSRKVKEAVLAEEISRRYSKDQILELYLNEIFYGNLAYGARAAAETYFGKDVKDLTLAEAALLAGIPQAPAYYDPYANLERARRRQGVVLSLMAEAGYITRDQAAAAAAEPIALVPLRFDLKAPHFTLMVREAVERLYGPEALYKHGLNVTTTLDGALQAEAERIVAEQVDALAGRHVTNGALVALRPESGEVVALVGSKDFNDAAISGQVNMAMAPRQPGSSIKPLAYLAAFEQPDKPAAERWTPGTLVADIRTEFPDGANPPYVPVNYDGREHGMVTVRDALANSYNIPAVKALQTVGLPAFLAVARRVGITTLTRPDYGLSLSLGAGEVPLIEMTGAFAVLASGGYRRAPTLILKVTDSAGNVVCDAADPNRPCQPGPVGSGIGRERAVDPVDAFLITDILRDNAARLPAFGPGSALELDRPAAVKTGTTNDYRDNLTIGFTPRLVTGVWVGNADNSPMQGVSGVTGAGPIWNAFMRAAHRDLPVEDFAPPAGVRQWEICADTGTQPSEACPARRTAWFADDRPPLAAEHDLWQRVPIDRDTGGWAEDGTPRDRIDEVVFKIYPLEHRGWATAHGIPQPPDRPVPPEARPAAEIDAPDDGDEVTGRVEIIGTARAPDLTGYEVAVAAGFSSRGDWTVIARSDQPVSGGRLAVWDTRGLPPGAYTLRLTVEDGRGDAVVDRVRVTVVADSPTATPTATPTAGPTAAATPSPTAVPSPAIPSPSPAATETPKPSPAPA